MAHYVDQVPVSKTSTPKSLYGDDRGWRLQAQEILCSGKNVSNQNGEKQIPGTEFVVVPPFLLRQPMDVCRGLARREPHFVNVISSLKKFLGKFTRYRQNSIFMRLKHFHAPYGGLRGWLLPGPTLLVRGD